MSIDEEVKRILDELPAGVTLEAAAKTRSVDEIEQAIAAGVTVIGQNYVREAEQARAVVKSKARWHLIGHLQRNKAGKAAALFDMIETLDSLELAAVIDKKCAVLGRVMPVLIEVNSGREGQKTGVFPEQVEGLIDEIRALPNVRVAGLMTLGPAGADAEATRTCFRETKQLYDRLAAGRRPGVEMKYLSMGMSASYRLAIEEGANLVRLGTAIFGPR